jgi:LmbE family N-acetylglucosaminyl deacetylase
MNDTLLQLQGGKPLRILCLGAHCDDIEIGCGGTILRLLQAHSVSHVEYVVFSSTPNRRKEAERAASLFLRDAKSKRVAIHKFRDGFFPYDGARIKEEFERMKQMPSPDLIFTHYRDDLHQDHRLVQELTWNTFRQNLILEYEIPKYDGDLGSPNCFVRLTREQCEKKVSHLFEAFPTQAKKHWFTTDFFSALMRIRGVEAGGRSQYAEAFYCRKLVL